MKHSKLHYHLVHPFWDGVPVTFQTGCVITGSSYARSHSATWQFLKSAPEPTAPPTKKVSISNWKMDGLMVYKMTHPSLGLNRLREHHSVKHAFFKSSVLMTSVQVNTVMDVFIFPAVKGLFSRQKRHICLLLQTGHCSICIQYLHYWILINKLVKINEKNNKPKTKKIQNLTRL